jgi:uncharacterized protein YceK
VHSCVQECILTKIYRKIYLVTCPFQLKQKPYFLLIIARHSFKTTKDVYKQGRDYPTLLLGFGVVTHTVLLPCSILLLGVGAVTHTVLLPCSILLLGFGAVTHTVLLPCSILLLGFGAVTHIVLLPCSILLMGFGAVHCVCNSTEIQ